MNLVTLSPRPATVIAFECNFLMYDATFVCNSNSFSIFSCCIWVMVEHLRNETQSLKTSASLNLQLKINWYDPGSPIKIVYVAV